MIEKKRKMIFNQPVNQVTDKYSMFMPILYLSSWKWILDLSSYSNFDIQYYCQFFQTEPAR